MFLKNAKRLVIIIIVSIFLVSCGGIRFGEDYEVSSNVIEEEDGEYEEEIVDTVLLDGISEIEFDSVNTATLSIARDASKRHVLSIYSYDESGDFYSYEIGTQENVVEALVRNGEAGEEDISSDVHGILRQFESELEGERAEGGSDRLLRTTRDTGSTRTFKVINSLSSAGSYDVVTAELRYVAPDFYVYVDERNESVLTDEEIEDVVGPFSAVVEGERNIFGSESDVDGDGHFTILITEEVNKLGASGGGIVTGFFYAVDLYAEKSYPASNEMEIIYSAVPDPSGLYGYPLSKAFALSNILPAVFPHEFQHMINYNQHVFVRGGMAEVAPVNEGLSHLAEDMYSIDADGYMAQTGIENPSRVFYYLNAVENTCFACGTSLAQRGGSYLFLRYLYEQAEKGNLPEAESGADFVQRMMGSGFTGVDNIVYSAVGSTSQSAFKFLMGRFSLAVYLSDSGLTDDERYEFAGISLRDDQNDFRGTILRGPAMVLPSQVFHSGTISPTGIVFVELSKMDLSTTGGELPLALSGNMRGGGFLVELGL